MRNQGIRTIIDLLVLASVAVVPAAQAQVYFSQGGTLDSDITAMGGAVVGFDPATQKLSPCSITVSSAALAQYVEVLAGSSASVEGGNIGFGQAVGGSLTIDNGVFANLQAGDNTQPASTGTVTINAGSGVGNAFQAFGLGTLTVNGGSLVGEFDAGVHLITGPTAEAPQLNLLGGTLTANPDGHKGVFAYDQTQLALGGMQIANDVDCFDNVNMTMSAGSVGGNVAFHNNALGVLFAGTITGSVSAADNSNVTLENHAGAATAGGTALLTVRGATIDGGLSVGDAATARVNDATIGGDVNFGPSAGFTTSAITGSGIGGNLLVGGLVNLNVTLCVIQHDFQTTASIREGFPSVVLSGCQVDGNVSLGGTSQTTINLSPLQNVSVNADAILTVGTGTSASNVAVNDSAIFNLNDGAVSSINAARFSTVNIAGGSVSTVTSAALGNAFAGGLTITGGSASSVIINENGYLHLNGGQITSTLTLNEQARCDINSGIVAGTVFLTGSPTFSLNGGRVQSISNVSTGGAVTITGGQVDENVTVSAVEINGANFDQRGGKVGSDVDLSDGAVGFLEGGEVGLNVTVHPNSVFFMFGGQIDGQVVLIGNGQFSYDGGQIGGLLGSPAAHPAAGAAARVTLTAPATTLPDSAIVANDQSSVEIDGSGLVATLVDAGAPGGFSEYLVAGALDDGTPLSGLPMFIQNPDGPTPGATFVIVNSPEPAAVATAGLLVAAGFSRTRRSLRRLADC